MAEEQEDAVKTVKRIQFWATLAAGVAAAGFSAALFLSRYAQADDVEKLAQRIEAHAAAEERRVTALEIAFARVEEDLHVFQDQLHEIAGRLNARSVPLPVHRQ